MELGFVELINFVGSVNKSLKYCRKSYSGSCTVLTLLLVEGRAYEVVLFP